MVVVRLAEWKGVVAMVEEVKAEAVKAAVTVVEREVGREEEGRVVVTVAATAAVMAEG